MKIIAEISPPKKLLFKYFIATFFLINGMLPMLAEASSEQKQIAQNSEIDRLKKSFYERPFGYHITQGAAAGYIDDKACGTCHHDMYQSYQSIGMSRSFVKPEPKHYIENFDAPAYFHPLSQRYYEVRRVGDDIYFKRYQLDHQGQKINQYEKKIDWILGSGNKTRTYLYQTEIGEIFQLPIGWYNETQAWALSPGYEKKHHQGINRQVVRQCLFCHNAFPEVPEGSDMHWQPHTFPKNLPHGTGCQRCHGPGGQHIQKVISKASVQEIRDSIVNPARLEVHKRDSVCFQCHMLPAVSVVGIRRFDRPDYSFRPGEMITDYLLHIDVTDPNLPKNERFEINHHAYRLTQSRCFQESQGELTCISCHNPHQKVASKDRIQHYSPICLKCHEKHDTSKISSTIKRDDCTTCHMPKTRTQDVIHVVMTDHMIQKQSKPYEQRMAALQETAPVIDGIEFLMPEFSPQGALGEIYKTITLLRTVPTEDSLAYLKQQINQGELKNKRVYFDLAKAEILLKKYADAEKTVLNLLKSYPDHYVLKQWMGIILLGQGKTDLAEEYFRKALELNKKLPDIHFNMGLLLYSKKQYQKAQEMLKLAIQLRPNMSKAWYYLGLTSVELEKNQDATQQFKRALSINPSNTRAYIEIIKLFVQLGNKKEAVRFLKHGLSFSQNPKKITQTLQRLKNQQ